MNYIENVAGGADILFPIDLIDYFCYRHVMVDPLDKNIYSPYQRLVDYAIDALKDLGRDPVLLDAGCGHSTALEEQYKRCGKVIGVDMDRKALNRNVLIDTKVFADMTNVPLPDDSVDIIVSAWVLEHVEKPEIFIKECDRLLRSGGYFIFIAPNVDGWYAVLASEIPYFIHEFFTKLLYKRGEGDTYKAYYRLNSEEDMDRYLVEDHKYTKIKYVYNDDPRYIGFTIFTRPLAWLWQKIVMMKRMEKFRLHVIGLYKKPS